MSPLHCIRVQDFSGILDLKVTQAVLFVDAGWLSLQHVRLRAAMWPAPKLTDKLHKMKVTLKSTLPARTVNM